MKDLYLLTGVFKLWKVPLGFYSIFEVARSILRLSISHGEFMFSPNNFHIPFKWE